MADEPRRSVRATKGQHTKTHDILDQPAEPKKKASKKSKKAAQKEEEEEAETIRCVCGVTVSADDDGEAWIACDSCTVWQHNVCVGVSTFDEDLPEHYLCEQCGPEFHKPLLDAIKRGEKLWLTRRAQYEKEIDDQEKEPKKKGKKGKGKRVSDVKSEVAKNANGNTKSPSVAVETPKKEPISRAGSTKRKTRDESQDNEAAKQEPQSKIRKVSTPAAQPPPKSPASGLPVKIVDLESTRQHIAKFLQKTLSQTISNAVKSEAYKLSPKDNVEAKSERLAIEIEDAIYKTHPDKAAYVKQSRSISANLKQNAELTEGLLTRSLLPHTLAVMTTDDMASSELKRETAEMKARADKQAIMITDDGPRVRRTHKGDEVVEGDNFAVANDSTMSTSRRRSMLDPNGDMAARSRENSPGNEVELPESIDDYRSRDDIRGNTIPKQPLSIDTKPTPEASRTPSGGNFDLAKVFSSVQSPTAAQHAQHARRASTNVNPQPHATGADPDIDRMLQDDDANESPPYSPAEYNSDPETVWRGLITMDSIAKFSAAAKHIAGANLGSVIPWDDLFQKELKIAGRIDTDKANEYLCSLRYSPNTDITVVHLTPSGEAAEQGYKAMFEYFHSKKRFGVMSNKSAGNNIRDTYLIPVPASPANLPDFIINLEGHNVPENRPEPTLLIAVVIRNELPLPAPVDATPEAQTPTLVGHPQRQMSIAGTGPSMSPVTTQGGFPPVANSQNPQPGSPDEAHRRQAAAEQSKAQANGEIRAAGILGELFNVPTVAFLMPQAHQMRPIEWEIIHDVLLHDERAREDLTHLSQVLVVRMEQRGQTQNAVTQGV